MKAKTRKAGSDAIHLARRSPTPEFWHSPFRLPAFCLLPSSFASVSSVLKILAYFLGTLFLGALLAPPLFWAGHALGGAWPRLHWLAETDFQRFFDRAMFLAALLLLPPSGARAARSAAGATWACGRPPRLDARRARLRGGRWAALAAGLGALGAWGFTSPAPASRAVGGAGRFPAHGGRRRGGGGSVFPRRAARAGRAHGVAAATALVFVSALFAVLHFLKPPEHVPSPWRTVRWWSGFAFLPKTFWQWREPGWCSAGSRRCSRWRWCSGSRGCARAALWLPMGLHAGWVFGLKSFAKVSRHPARPNSVDRRRSAPRARPRADRAAHRRARLDLAGTGTAAGPRGMIAAPRPG